MTGREARISWPIVVDANDSRHAPSASYIFWAMLQGRGYASSGWPVGPRLRISAQRNVGSPSTASTTSSIVMSSAGLASEYPPALPREDSTIPAADSAWSDLAKYDGGRSYSAARSAAASASPSRNPPSVVQQCSAHSTPAASLMSRFPF